MSYCAKCKRYLNGALSCAGCGTTAGTADDHPTMALPQIRPDEPVPGQPAPTEQPPIAAPLRADGSTPGPKLLPVPIPAPVPLTIPTVPPKPQPHAVASASAAAAGAEIGADESGGSSDAGGAAAGGRRLFGRRSVSTGVMVGGVAVVAILIGGVIFTGSTGGHESGQFPSPTGPLHTTGSAPVSPALSTGGHSGSGQSAAPTHTATAKPSFGATPTSSPGGAVPSQTPTATANPTMTPLTLPTSTPAPAGPFTVTAAQYSSSNDIGTEPTTDPGVSQDVGWITDGSWLAYDNVTFPGGMAGTVKIRFASTVQGADFGSIEFRLGSVTAPPFATFEVSGTGGWQDWTTSRPVTESPVPQGTYTLYVTFTNGGGDFVNVNWFQFG
jgi:Carbohydrate binding module (family 6)